MSDCKHPLWERIRLCDNGACPDCLAARLAAAERRAEEAERKVFTLETEWVSPRSFCDCVDAALARAEAAEVRLRALVLRLEAVHDHPRYQAVWEVAQAHLGTYDGPTYIEELAAARRAMRSPGDPE